ncbi:MAG TPA: nucleotidyltransferase family protein [Syntrophomonadaceae bacterium]|nr:nucleotidyltransferase family protein [Syntrophomonadaceae bacterium]
MGVEGVVLAAGFSSRVGVNKLLLELGGRSILDRCLGSMKQVCSRIIIVGGHRILELEASLKPSPQLEIVFNEDYAEGMFSSVQKGIRQVREERFFLCPGDYPLIKEQTYIDLLSQEGQIIVPTCQDRPGHPVLIASRLIQDILGGGYSSLKDFIKLHSPTLLEVPDPGIHMDVDTLEDYENITLRFLTDEQDLRGDRIACRENGQS